MNKLIALKKALKTIISSDNKLYDAPPIREHPRSNIMVKISHVSAFTYANAGDTVLPLAVRDSMQLASDELIEWQGVRVHGTVDNKYIDLLNATNGVVIGGGGLFLKDTNKNQESGWQWACSMANFNKIKVPVALFAVGYNRFRDQDDFDPIFTKNINNFIEKCVFFGLRNSGSIKNMKRYIDPKFHHKVKFQPCPTTILSKLYPELTVRKPVEKPFIAFNCAFDRPELRFGQEATQKLAAIARVAKKLSKDYVIKYFVHCLPDETFLPYLDEEKVDYEIVNLQIHPRLIVEEYSKPALTIGMRGHAQMIPFGCQTPILSIISHEKVKWFLKDINHLDWGCDIQSSTFEEELEEKALYILNNKELIATQLAEAQDELFDVTKDNVELLAKSFKLR